MEITEVRIKLADEVRERLHAFCSITLDGCFVIRDLKIIEGARGPFVAMPSRKLTDRCSRCQCKNCLRALYCGQCGVRLPERRPVRIQDGRSKLYADIAHPINSACREAIQARVLDAYRQELVLAQQPGYVCRYDDFGGDDFDHFDDWSEPSTAAPLGDCRRVEPPSLLPGPHSSRRGDEPRTNLHVPVAVSQSTTDEEFGVGLIEPTVES